MLHLSLNVQYTSYTSYRYLEASGQNTLGGSKMSLPSIIKHPYRFLLIWKEFPSESLDQPETIAVLHPSAYRYLYSVANSTQPA